MSTAPRDDLRLLAIFHFVLAGLAALFSLFPLIHVAVGVGLVTGKLGSGGRGGPPDFFGWIFVVVGALVIFTGLCYAVLVALAGRFLARRRNWTFCMVMAGLSCAFFPFGHGARRVHHHRPLAIGGARPLRAPGHDAGGSGRPPAGLTELPAFPLTPR